MTLLTQLEIELLENVKAELTAKGRMEQMSAMEWGSETQQWQLRNGMAIGYQESANLIDDVISGRKTIR